MIDCLKNAVGLSQNDCVCLESNRPEGYNESASGYFVDDPYFGLNIQYPHSSADCGKDNVWQIMEQARDKGIRQTIDEIAMAATGSAMGQKKGFRGQYFANHKTSFYNAPLKKLDAGQKAVRYTPKNNMYKGMVWRLDKVEHIFETEEEITVQIFNSISSEVQHEYTVTTEAKKITTHTFDTPLTLPMSEGSTPITWHFVYTSTAKPMNVKFDCGCGTKPDMHKYVKGEGHNGSDWNTALRCNQSPYTMGLRPYGSITCDTTAWICDLDDFATDTLARTVAHTVQLNSVLAFTGIAYASGKINYYTVIEQEKLQEIRQYIQEIKLKNLPYIIQEMPPNDCFQCDAHRVEKVMMNML